jgi:O-antigen/teichoic acid export membrane protein
MIDKSMKYTACMLLPIGLGVGFFAKDIITTIFGEEFIYSVVPLLILIFGTTIFGVIRSIGGSIAGVGRPDIGLKLVWISATTNIVLNVLLIPHYGIIGAAIATTVSWTVHTLLGLFFTIKILMVKIDFKWYMKISGITLLSIILFMCLGFLNVYLVGAIILCSYTFIIAISFLTKEDRRYFMELAHDARSFLKALV